MEQKNNKGFPNSIPQKREKHKTKRIKSEVVSVFGKSELNKKVRFNAQVKTKIVPKQECQFSTENTLYSMFPCDYWLEVARGYVVRTNPFSKLFQRLKCSSIRREKLKIWNTIWEERSKLFGHEEVSESRKTFLSIVMAASPPVYL